MLPYVVFISELALASAPKSGSQRESVMKFIRSLADNPGEIGDFTEKDDAGRVLQVKVIGRHAIAFWADHAVSEIKVTHIKLADK
jgi:hypothetical protein